MRWLVSGCFAYWIEKGRKTDDSTDLIYVFKKKGHLYVAEKTFTFYLEQSPPSFSAEFCVSSMQWK